MYSIGEFSKIGSVSTKTLRYYDEIGLIHPAYVDKENHYRYYSEDQVYEILFVSELKCYDLRLEQIKAILESKVSIQLKQCIERKMQQIQLGGNMMDGKLELIVEAKEYKPVLVVSKKATIEIFADK